MLTTPTDAPAAVQRFLGDDEEAEERLTELRAEVCDIIRAMDGGGITKPKDARMSRENSMFCGQRHTGHLGANCAPYYWVIMGSGRCVYYVLYCIKIIRVLYLYYVFAYPAGEKEIP